MKAIFEIGMVLVVGFFTGIFLSGGGIDLRDSGIYIILSCIFWLLVLIYLKLSSTDQSRK